VGIPREKESLKKKFTGETVKKEEGQMESKEWREVFREVHRMRPLGRSIT